MDKFFFGLIFFLGVAFADLALADVEFNSKTKTYSGFIKVRKNKELYLEYIPPKKGVDQTVVLLNGLTYSLRQFDGLAQSISRRGYGVLRFDFDGMGETLLKYAPSLAPYPVKDQVEDMKSLLDQLDIKPPYNLVGLSYGGGVGVLYALTHPAEVKNLILMAPYTQPLEGQDKWIRSQIWATRQMFPFNTMTDDELYEYFLHQIVFATYPQAEPIVLENPFKLEAIYNLVRGIRKFLPIEKAPQLPTGKVHLMVSGRDQYIPRAVLDSFWDKTKRAAKMSRILVDGVEHKMNEVAPHFTASWIIEIVEGNPLLFQGRDFDGQPSKGTAKSGSDVIRLGKD